PTPMVTRPTKAARAPTTCKTIIIYSTPRISRASACHDTVILFAPPSAICRPHPRMAIQSATCFTYGYRTPLRSADRCCNAIKAATANYATIDNYVVTGTALYGCRGTRPKGARAGPQGTPGYQ